MQSFLTTLVSDRASGNMDATPEIRRKGRFEEPKHKDQKNCDELLVSVTNVNLGASVEYKISGQGLQTTTKPSASDLGLRARLAAVCMSLKPKFRAAFVPEAELVAPEFWPRRRLICLDRILSEVKGILTIQAMYVAMGVGNEAASPAALVVMNELNNVVFRTIGLSLGGWWKSTIFAANAKLICCINAFYSHIAHGIFDLWLLYCPQHLAINLFIKGVLGAAWAVVNSPAQAAICNHVKATKVAAKMAQVDQQNTNQELVLKYLMIMVRLVLFVQLVEHFRLPRWQLWAIYWSLSALQVTISLRLVAIAAMPTFNTERLKIVCDATAAATAAAYVATVPTPSQVSHVETWIPRHGSEDWQDVVIGVSGEEVIKGIASMHSNSSSPGDATCLDSQCKISLGKLLDLHASDKYVIAGCFARRCVLVMLKESATPNDQIRAWWHGHRACRSLRIASSTFRTTPAPNNLSQEFLVAASESRPSDAEWRVFLDALVRKGWWCDQVLLPAASEWRLAAESANGSDNTTDVSQLTQVRRTSDGAFICDPLMACNCNRASDDNVSDGNTKHIVVASRFCWLYSLLVPVGYPGTVAPEYMQYQLWDTLQVMTEELRGIILQQASIIAVGVGVKGMTPLSSVKTDIRLQVVAISVSLLAGLICDPSRSVSTMKSWRVYNTLLSYYGAAITLLQGIWPHNRLWLSTAHIAIKDLIGPFGRGAGLATVMHLSNESLDAAFRADVSAKEANQDRVLGLLLMATRFMLLFYVGTNFFRAWVVAAILSIGHIAMNAMAVRVLKLKTLNNERLLHVASAWHRGDHDGMTPMSIASNERLLPWLSVRPWSTPFVGVKLEDLLDDGHQQNGTQRKLFDLFQCHEADGYILGYSMSKKQFQVALKVGSSSEDQLRSWLHAFLAARQVEHCTPASKEVLKAILGSHGDALRLYPEFFKQLELSGWAVDEARFKSGRSVLLCAGPWRVSTKAE